MDLYNNLKKEQTAVLGFILEVELVGLSIAVLSPMQLLADWRRVLHSSI